MWMVDDGLFVETYDKQGTIASAWPAANTVVQCGSQIQCDFMLVILPSFVLKQLAVGRPLYIGDKDIIIINSKSNIKYQGNYILL